MAKCNYQSPNRPFFCIEEASTHSEHGLCMFHDPPPENVIPFDRWRELWRQKYESGRADDHRFDGFIFPYEISFKRLNFDKSISFEGAIFKKNVDFVEANFTNANFQSAMFEGLADFTKARFAGNSFFNIANFNEVTFADASFDGDTRFEGIEVSNGINFRGSSFQGEKVSFRLSKIFGNSEFSESTFDCIENNFSVPKFRKSKSDKRETVTFFRTTFNGDVNFESTRFELYVNFFQTEFLGSDNYFDHTLFLEGGLFEICAFEGRTQFQDNTFSKKTTFSSCSIGEKAKWFFIRTVFRNHESGEWTVVEFDHIKFAPHSTYFEALSVGEIGKGDKTEILFDFCGLEDVLFIRVNMGFVRSKTSNLSEARLTQCYWRNRRERLIGFLRYDRVSLLFEDNDIATQRSEGKLKKFNRADWWRLSSEYREIADHYGSLKTSFDKVDLHNDAGFFFYNKCEMERLALGAEIKAKFTLVPDVKWLIPAMKWLTYSTYKVTAGYGEKPLWSLIGFWFSTLVFSFIHFFNGFKVESRIVQYKISLQDCSLNAPVKTVLSDWLYSVYYSLNHVNPLRSFFGSPIFSYSSVNHSSIIFSFLNTLFLGGVTILFGISVKRYFRRY